MEEVMIDYKMVKLHQSATVSQKNCIQVIGKSAVWLQQNTHAL